MLTKGTDQCVVRFAELGRATLTCRCCAIASKPWRGEAKLWPGGGARG